MSILYLERNCEFDNLKYGIRHRRKMKNCIFAYDTESNKIVEVLERCKAHKKFYSDIWAINNHYEVTRTISGYKKIPLPFELVMKKIIEKESANETKTSN